MGIRSIWFFRQLSFDRIGLNQDYYSVHFRFPLNSLYIVFVVTKLSNQPHGNCERACSRNTDFQGRPYQLVCRMVDCDVLRSSDSDRDCQREIVFRFGWRPKIPTHDEAAPCFKMSIFMYTGLSSCSSSCQKRNGLLCSLRRKFCGLILHYGMTIKQASLIDVTKRRTWARMVVEPLPGWKSKVCQQESCSGHFRCFNLGYSLGIVLGVSFPGDVLGPSFIGPSLPMFSLIMSWAPVGLGMVGLSPSLDPKMVLLEYHAEGVLVRHCAWKHHVTMWVMLGSTVFECMLPTQMFKIWSKLMSGATESALNYPGSRDTRINRSGKGRTYLLH
jgi:hypothetical protein